MAAGDSFGFDVISEILSHSSLKMVGKCRLLSREFNSLTYEPHFIQLHSQRTRTIRGFFIQTCIKDKYFFDFVSTENPNCEMSLKFLPAPVEILACTNQGLVLCKSTSFRHRAIPQFYVCKPTTKEWQQIPNPKTRYFTQHSAMMILPSTNGLRYKIMRLSDPSPFRNFNRKLYSYYSFRCEIFDSETWVWKQLEEIHLPRDELLNLTPPISVCGAFHWLTSKNNILAFNMNEETWRMLPLPEELQNLHLRLMEYEGKLAVIGMGREKGGEMELWVMERYSRRSWNKRHKVITKPLEKEVPYVMPHLEAFCNADIALMSDYYKVIFYNFKKGSFDVVKVDKVIDSHGIFAFQSDLEPSNLTVRRTRSIPKPANNNGSIHHRQLGYISLNPVSIFIMLLIALTLFCYFFDF